VNPIKYGNRIGNYVFATGLGAVAFGSAFHGPDLVCNIYGYCGGGHTAQAFLIALASGAAIGLVGAALIDIAVQARYALTNRQIAKQRQRKPPHRPN
jgi:hypothetical protein